MPKKTSKKKTSKKKMSKKKTLQRRGVETSKNETSKREEARQGGKAGRQGGAVQRCRAAKKGGAAWCGELGWLSKASRGGAARQVRAVQ